MTLEEFIITYGYLALFAGCLLEGGTVVVIAGALAHQGYLRLEWVIGITFCCAFGADQLFFQVGKRNGPRVLERLPKLAAKINRVRLFLVTWQILAIMGFRFIYGMRTITPIVIGMSGFKTRNFVVLNLCSTLLWAGTISIIGYFFGHLIRDTLTGFGRYAVMIVAAAAVFILTYRHYRRPPGI